MREISLLKFLINIFYYLVLFATIAIVLFVIVSAVFFDGVGFFVNSDTYVVLNEELSHAKSWRDYAVVLGGIISMLIFLTSIYHLRNATLKIVNGEMYHKKVIHHLRLTGQFMILYVIFKSLFEFIKKLIYVQEFTIGFDFDGYDSSIFLIILGLFFMLIARVLDHARLVKTENDLTI